jgi:DNA-binding protein HU-beta
VNRQEVITAVMRETGLNRGDADRAITAFLDTVTEELKRGGDVSLPGFGKFTTQQRAARSGVNPRNPAERVQIPEARVPKFTAGSSLKSAVKQS